MKHELRNSFGKVYLTISFDQTNGWIYNQWRGMISVENVMQGATQVLQAMRETACCCILNDNRLITGSWNQANTWLEQVWMPQALALGLRRFAHLLPAGALGISSAEEMKKRAGGQFEMGLFREITEAQVWLKEVQNIEA